jgi:hypothetical protein
VTAATEIAPCGRGTRYRYITRRCRCSECKEADRAYRLRRRRAGVTVTPPDAPLRRRLPFEPLERLLQFPTTQALARFAGVDGREVYRWKAKGIPAHRGDALAVRAGFHPGEVWAEWWSHGEQPARGPRLPPSSA